MVSKICGAPQHLHHPLNNIQPQLPHPLDTQKAAMEQEICRMATQDALNNTNQPSLLVRKSSIENSEAVKNNPITPKKVKQNPLDNQHFNKEKSVIMNSLRRREKKHDHLHNKPPASNVYHPTDYFDSDVSSQSEHEDLSDTTIIFDTSIKCGPQYQATIPDRCTGDFSSRYPVQEQQGESPFLIVEVDNYTKKPIVPVYQSVRGIEELSYAPNPGTRLVVQIQKRSLKNYLEWDPSVSSKQEFINKVYFLSKLVQQEYNLELYERDFLEYFQICKMNKELFCATIHNDMSPFIDFVHKKRAQAN